MNCLKTQKAIHEADGLPWINIFILFLLLLHIACKNND